MKQTFHQLFEETLDKVNHPHRIAGIAVGLVKGQILVDYVKETERLEGVIAEVGVWTGGSARLMAKHTAKDFYLFDTFEGIPHIDEKKDPATFLNQFGDNVGDRTLLQTAREVLDDCPNTIIVQGIFPATASIVEDDIFSFVHIDADVYPSVMDSCKFFYPRLTKKAVMVFDDYGYVGAPGAKAAVNEFFADKPEEVFVVPGTGQAVVKKL